jgi:Nif-specific regulatory protein
LKWEIRNFQKISICSIPRLDWQSYREKNEGEVVKEFNTDFRKTHGGDSKFTISPSRLMELFLVIQRINQINELQKLIDEILHSAITIIGAERGMIILTDETGEDYQTVASESLGKEDSAFSTSIVQATLDSKKTLMCANLQSDPRFKDSKSVKGLHILSFICVPLIVPGLNRALGTLYVDQRIYIKRFTKEDATFLEAFANLAAIAINNAMLMDQLVGENIELRQEVRKKYEFPGVIGQGKAMQKVFREMKQVLNDDCTVLITGESGSGKEVIAKAIHYNGNRKERPFLAINCGALPETLLEAELFGSVKGAFTGAVDKQGLFQAANGGTLFLDEIHHTSEAMQIKLLRVLQEKEIRRVGGTKTIKVNVRLICATNEDLRTTIQEGRFRQDFYYRINVVTIDVPALRDRREDIPVLANHFLEKYSKGKRKHFQRFDKRALEALIKYDWAENNVRELENEIEHAVIFAKGGNTIKLKDISEKIRVGVPTAIEIPDLLINEEGGPLTYDNFEKKYISFILSKVDNNQTNAAKIMGIPRTTLRGKMKKLGLSE